VLKGPLHTYCDKSEYVKETKIKIEIIPKELQAKKLQFGVMQQI
jgi:hypothetical protein